jgi:RNA polymerase sigma-B factor
VLAHELGRAPTASELSEHLGIEREVVLEGLIAANAYSTRSTDVPMGSDDDDDGPLLTDRLGSLDPNIDKVVDTETVRPLLEALPERERTVLVLRFFENMTQSQIAERVGVSQMHVSRLLASSLATMRDQIE